MLDRMSGKILHIDFGDCFEVAMTREKFPEKIPFRLTRMLVNAMEVSAATVQDTRRESPPQSTRPKTIIQTSPDSLRQSGLFCDWWLSGCVSLRVWSTVLYSCVRRLDEGYNVKKSLDTAFTHCQGRSQEF